LIDKNDNTINQQVNFYEIQTKVRFKYMLKNGRLFQNITNYNKKGKNAVLYASSSRNNIYLSLSIEDYIILLLWMFADGVFLTIFNDYNKC